MKWNPDILVRAILMVGAGVVTLISRAVMGAQISGQPLLSGLLLYLGLVLILLGLLAGVVAFVKGPDQ